MALLKPCRAPQFSSQPFGSPTQVWQACSRAPSRLLQTAYMQRQESQSSADNHRRVHSHDNSQEAHILTEINPEIDWDLYRRNVGICVVNREGRVFAAQRVDDKSGSWQMPQGGVDAGENSADAALRELSEETSITSVEIIGELPAWLKYDFPPEVRSTMKLSNIGQVQRWFLMRFTGEDHEINLDTEHREFSAWAWMPLDSLPTHVIHFKREVYEEVVRHFAPIIKELGHASRS